MDGQNIKKLRKAKGWTQHEFADKLGVNRSMIAKYETNEAQMAISTLLTACELLDATPNDLLGFTSARVAPDDDVNKEVIKLLIGQIKQKDEEIAHLKKLRAGSK